MDPNETTARLIAALDNGDWDAAQALSCDLAGWLARGGFAPRADLVDGLRAVWGAASPRLPVWCDADLWLEEVFRLS